MTQWFRRSRRSCYKHGCIKRAGHSSYKIDHLSFQWKPFISNHENKFIYNSVMTKKNICDVISTIETFYLPW